MLNKTPSNLKGSVFLSLSLHVAILTILIWGAFNYTTPLSGEGESNIQAIMVDHDVMEEQQRRQLQQQLALKKREEDRRKQAIEKAEFVEKQKIIEQTRLKRIERERLAALKKQQTAAAAAKKAAEEKRKALAEAAKAKALLEEQKKLLEETKKIEMDNRKQKEQDNALNDILGELTAIDRTAKAGEKHGELDRYTSLVHHAITNKFINSNLYHGKSCVLKLSLARDGLLLSVSSQGDQALCFAAESATRLAVFPKPESEGVYEKVKNFTIDFKPKKTE